MNLDTNEMSFINELIEEQNFEMFLHNENKSFEVLNLYEFWHYLEARLFLIYFKMKYKPNCKITCKTLYLFDLHHKNLNTILNKMKNKNDLEDYHFFKESAFFNDLQNKLKI